MSKLKRFIEKSGRTQRETASLLGMTEEHLSRVVNSKTKVTDEFVGRFVATFGAAAYDTVFGDSATPAVSEAVA